MGRRASHDAPPPSFFSRDQATIRCYENNRAHFLYENLFPLTQQPHPHDQQRQTPLPDALDGSEMHFSHYRSKSKSISAAHLIARIFLNLKAAPLPRLQ